MSGRTFVELSFKMAHLVFWLVFLGCAVSMIGEV